MNMWRKCRLCGKHFRSLGGGTRCPKHWFTHPTASEASGGGVKKSLKSEDKGDDNELTEYEV